MRSEAIESAGNDGARLRIEFAWRNDRYGHVISLVSGAGGIEPLLESVEGASDDAWPPSPPLQSLSIENLPDGRSAALLVGMAGRSHWSASVEPDSDSSALVFDMACRHQGTPQWLGSRYRQLSAGGARLSIRGEDCEVALSGNLVSLQAAAIASGGGTTRWRFKLIMPLSAAHPVPAEAMEPRR